MTGASKVDAALFSTTTGYRPERILLGSLLAKALSSALVAHVATTGRASGCVPPAYSQSEGRVLCFPLTLHSAHIPNQLFLKYNATHWNQLYVPILKNH